METTVEVKRKLVNGYHPISRATIIVGKPLSQEEQQASIGKLTQDFLPVKEEISKVVRKYWHNGYSFECFKTIKGEQQYFCFSCYLESALHERETLNKAVEKIANDLHNT